jgi:hypothetical protein
MEGLELEIERRYDAERCIFHAIGSRGVFGVLKASSLAARPSTLVGPLTQNAGVLQCRSGAPAGKELAANLLFSSLYT